MAAYIDTSALAKWYLPEARSNEFSYWIQTQADTYISSVTVTEFRCLLGRRQRMQDITVQQVQEIYACFLQDIQDGHLICCSITDQQVKNAALLIDRLPTIALRTLDAIHLNIAQDIPADIVASADRVMIEAGLMMGLQVVCFN